MKKVRLTLLLVGLSCIFLLPVNSCRKLEDLRLGLEDGNENLVHCSIHTLTQTVQDPSVVFVELTFAYNERKDPVTITPNLPDPIYSQWQFYYDRKGRLSQSITIHADGTFDRWHVYSHDARDRITGDSVYYFGRIGDRSTAVGTSLSHLEYDWLNRVIKETAAGPANPFSVEYTYNADGNLSRIRTNDNGSVTVQSVQGYARSLSLLLTNRIWRFLIRDYSVNSRTDPYSFNDHRLPTEYRGTGWTDLGNFFFGFHEDRQLLIQYDCQDNTDDLK